MNIVYLNGKFLPKEQATISVFDRGFLFGDAAYEVIPIYAGHFIGIEEHINRLQRSLDAIHMKMPLSLKEWRDIFSTLMKSNQVNEHASLYLQVTRGAYETRDHSIPKKVVPTVFAYLAPAKIKSFDDLARGFSAITVEDSRRRDCYIKSTCLLPNVLAHSQAQDQNCVEAIFIRNGKALEATSSNLFIVKDEILITPPLSANILGGTTRETVLRLARDNHIATQERDINEDELDTADEIWVTGCIKEICPITTLNGSPVGNGQVGPLWNEMIGLYYQYKNQAA